MQVMTSAPSSGRVAFKHGALHGVGLGVLQLLFWLVVIFSGAGTSFWLLTALSCLLWCVDFLLVGLFATKQTGNVGTGTLAGVWAGTIGGLITFIINLVVVLIGVNSEAFRYGLENSSSYNSTLTPQNLTSAAILGAIIIFVILWAVAVGVGAGVAALGGLIGKNQRQSSVAAFPGYPAPTAPGYPSYTPQGQQYTAQGQQYPPLPGQYSGQYSQPQSEYMQSPQPPAAGQSNPYASQPYPPPPASGPTRPQQ